MGGHEKSFYFNIALAEISEKYFCNKTMKDHLSEDYFKVGLIFGKHAVHNTECQTVGNVFTIMYNL